MQEAHFVLAAALFITAALIARLPVGHCPKCEHCAEAARVKQLEDKRRSDEYARSLGLRQTPRYECPQCEHCAGKDKGPQSD